MYIHYVNIYIYIYICIYIYYVCVYMCGCVCMRACMYACMCPSLWMGGWMDCENNTFSCPPRLCQRPVGSRLTLLSCEKGAWFGETYCSTEWGQQRFRDLEETLQDVLAARSYPEHHTFDTAVGLQVQPCNLWTGLKRLGNNQVKTVRSTFAWWCTCTHLLSLIFQRTDVLVLLRVLQSAW